jgi:hypothetical protein
VLLDGRKEKLMKQEMESREHTAMQIPSSDENAASEELEHGGNRRDMLRLLGAAAAGATAGSVLSASSAQAHGTRHFDSGNSAPAVHGRNTNNGPGVEGESANHIGVRGESFGDPGEPDALGVVGLSFRTGVFGVSPGGRGVHGDSVVGSGVRGTSDRGVGVLGQSDRDNGVLGESNTGFGVRGVGQSIGVRGVSTAGFGVLGNSETSTGVIGGSEKQDGVFGFGGKIGVFGVSSSATEPGVQAENSGRGPAFRVRGQAQFSSVGDGSVPPRTQNHLVEDPRVTANSHITVTLTTAPFTRRDRFGAPVAPTALSWVERLPGSGFVVHLEVSVVVATKFTYLIVEPVPPRRLAANPRDTLDRAAAFGSS